MGCDCLKERLEYEINSQRFEELSKFKIIITVLISNQISSKSKIIKKFKITSKSL